MTKRLTKEYERDFSLILEEPWAQGLRSSSETFLGGGAPLPFVVFFVNSENLQIWEHRAALDWYKDRLLEKNQQGPTFIQWVENEYAERLAPVEARWKAGPTGDKEALRKYMEENRRALDVLSLWYYAATDERTPEAIRAIALSIRNRDDYFASNNIFIKGCIDLLGGNRSLGNLAFSSEFPDLPSAETLEERTRGVVSVDGMVTHLTTLEEFAKASTEYEFEGLFDVVPDASEVKGQAAYRGSATGRVRILKNEQDMEDVQEGEVLVSPMTTPDFLPAMKLAAAIVTDEGGITCHAAIVARELKKPCVIGAKIATKIFKDGDMVEVDADNGIVRKL